VTAQSLPEEAAFVLATARAAGMMIGTDGDDLLVCSPLSMPRDVREAFHRALCAHQGEIIALIMREAGDGHPRH
jgi:hypothetical protein